MANILTNAVLQWLTAGEPATGSSDGVIIEGVLNRPLNELLNNTLALQSTVISVYGTNATVLGKMYEVDSGGELITLDVTADPRDKVYGVGTGVEGTIQTGLKILGISGMNDGRKWVDSDGTLRDDANVGSGKYRIFVGVSRGSSLYIQLENNNSTEQP